MLLPSFYDFNARFGEVQFFNKKLDAYLQSNSVNIWEPNIEETCTVNGRQTNNLLELGDVSINSKLDDIKRRFEKQFSIGLEYVWVHYVCYNEGGRQDYHSHEHAEDLSCILYLNTCEDGNTVFQLTPKLSVSKKPVRGKGVIFDSKTQHCAEVCTSNKKVLVLGFKLLLDSED